MILGTVAGDARCRRGNTRMHIRLRQMCIREWSRVRRLGRLDVLGARTLGALADLERHSLSFAK
jgi:hypothetical protein